jgi:hypothetical protein
LYAADWTVFARKLCAACSYLVNTIRKADSVSQQTRSTACLWMRGGPCVVGSGSVALLWRRVGMWRADVSNQWGRVALCPQGRRDHPGVVRTSGRQLLLLTCLTLSSQWALLEANALCQPSLKGFPITKLCVLLGVQ